MRILLYRRGDCALCDHAKEALRGAGVEYESVDVGWAGDLARRYGARIPVLCCSETGAELAWPFDVRAVRRFVGQA